MSLPRKLHPSPLGDTDPFTPTAARPVRVRAREMPVDSHFEPHRHAWAQLAYCASGVIQVNLHAPTAPTSYIVPPSRAVWIAPGALHAVAVLETAAFRTLYIDPSVVPPDWSGCRVMAVTPLLRELVSALDPVGGPAPGHAREAALTTLVLDEIGHAESLALGVPLPGPHSDKRLRAVCQAVLEAPGRYATLQDWAADSGASERTLARLFRAQFGMGFAQWRKQAVLAHALPRLARGEPVGQVAAASGYASESAFSAMFKAAMGQSPSWFIGKNSL
ncbi:MAG: helix-turn-helix transcriptional regulator [Gammaproteobacteria bacterium]|nr:helix-turn-helix transcriptional regulator [Gammaproteobacteria bacterium]MBU0826901.1 helix-turn-helix transcriptional regulator [Gammaproteobacteria bacterium]MBU1817646.1 helix-turn-helix transcriptional regulator [Gammaproteobacteria bacterium]